jgi:hypothetical protein
MKFELCGCKLDNQDEDDELDYQISAVYKEELCWNCWYERTYGDYRLKITDNTRINNINKIGSHSDIISFNMY